MTFGDFDPDDAADTALPDPEQVARRLRRIGLREGLDTEAWDDLDLGERVVLIAVVAELLEWLGRQRP